MKDTVEKDFDTLILKWWSWKITEDYNTYLDDKVYVAEKLQCNKSVNSWIFCNPSCTKWEKNCMEHQGWKKYPLEPLIGPEGDILTGSLTFQARGHTRLSKYL